VAGQDEPGPLAPAAHAADEAGPRGVVVQQLGGDLAGAQPGGKLVGQGALTAGRVDGGHPHRGARDLDQLVAVDRGQDPALPLGARRHSTPGRYGRRCGQYTRAS
jgi:hypothetical protein